jgi:hypothetical protein
MSDKFPWTDAIITMAITCAILRAIQWGAEMKAKTAFSWPAQQQLINDRLERAIETLVQIDSVAQVAIGTGNQHKQQSALCDIRRMVHTCLNKVDR